MIETRSPVACGDRVRGDRGVVEEAVAAVHRPRGVVAGRPAQPVGGLLAAEHEVDGRQRDVHRRARRDIGPGDERRRGIQSPEAGSTADVVRLADEGRDRLVAHPLEHRAVRVRVRRQEGARDALPADLGPGDLEEPDEARIVDRGDRRLAVLGRTGQREPAVRLEGRADPLGALGDLVGGHGDAHVGLVGDVVGEVDRRVDDLHATFRLR